MTYIKNFPDNGGF